MANIQSGWKTQASQNTRILSVKTNPKRLTAATAAKRGPMVAERMLHISNFYYMYPLKRKPCVINLQLHNHALLSVGLLHNIKYLEGCL